MSLDLEDFKEMMKKDLTPKAVVCSRGKLGSQTYDAEVSFAGTHYVVVTEERDHDRAKAIAQNIVDLVAADMKTAAMAHLNQLKIAKP